MQLLSSGILFHLWATNLALHQELRKCTNTPLIRPSFGQSRREVYEIRLSPYPEATFNVSNVCSTMKVLSQSKRTKVKGDVLIKPIASIEQYWPTSSDSRTSFQKAIPKYERVLVIT